MTKLKIKGILTRFFAYCIDTELININPCTKAIKLKNTETPKEMLIWDEEEFKTFICAVDNLIYNGFFSFLYLTGSRRGEALALTWKDICDNVVTINKSLGYHTQGGSYKITSTKNIYSNRRIVIPQALISILSNLKQYYQQFEMFSESNFVFGNLSPLPAQSIKNHLKKGCAKSGVKLIRIHDIRHSHASLLISKNHDIVTIARRLGHKDIEMTLNRYAHLMPNKQIELMTTLDTIL